MEIIGRRTQVNLPELGGLNVIAKVDTGAFRTAVHCNWCDVVEENGVPTLKVQIAWDEHSTRDLSFTKFQKRTIKNSFGQTEERYCIRTLIIIKKKKIRSEVSFSDRSGMRYPVLLGRKTIGKKFLVDVSSVN